MAAGVCASLPSRRHPSERGDARGNVTSQVHTRKPGSITTPATITTSATYAPTCANAKTCNKPLTTTDARGQVTNYQWNATHGGLDWVRAPADSSGVRPETRVAYQSVSARYLTGPGTYANGTAITMPSTTSSCRIATSSNPASCVGTADERVTSIAYPSGVPSNAQPSSVTTKAGNNTLVATSAVTYDSYGRVLTVDGPLSGTADTARVRYNLAGQAIGRVGPDPDDTAMAKHPAARYHYNARGQLYLTESGTVTDQSDSAWAAFSPADYTLVLFDGYFRPQRQQVGSGATVHQVVDTVYDSAGRVDCSIVRMSPALWGNIAGTCAPQQAGDRVTRNHYDNLNRVWKVTTALGSGTAEADDQIATFTNNGQLLTLTDGEANRTTYEYDGHDRLVKTFFPSPTTDNTSSATDYEQVGYDAGGNVTSYRTRRGETLTMTYDNLGRLVTKVVPERSGLAATHTRDVYFGYDLFGGMTYARFDSAAGEGVTNAYDALGQLTSSTTNLDGASHALSYLYDVAGSRTRITHPDGNYAVYVYSAAGAFAAINLGVTGLIDPNYDSAGRLAQIRRYNGSSWVQSSWVVYDPLSRLTTLALDPAGTSDDASTTFTYNPAGQIASSTRNNDLYAWTGAVNVNRGYTANGLNQYSAAGALSLTYDAGGNLISDGGNTYVYDVENRLVTRSGGAAATLRYDPLGRLHEVTGPGGTRRFLYDGSDLIAEYNTAGTMLRRYVHGLGAGDDPLAWIEGSGVTYADRRHLYADERGSIVAVTDNLGNVLHRNSYDEYGIPGAGNAGAFQYTGQVWLPELGMYHYKARMYSPTLGRFMQTDPIGYGDGMNMYAYVGNDPVNLVDPSGLGQEWGCITVGGDRGCGWHWDGRYDVGGGGAVAAVAVAVAECRQQHRRAFAMCMPTCSPHLAQ